MTTKTTEPKITTPDEARAILASLEARLDAGDTTITAEALLSARTAVEVADRQAAARERIAAAALENTRKERIGQLLDTAGEWGRDPKLEALREALQAVMSDFLTEAERFVPERKAAMDELRRLVSDGPAFLAPDTFEPVAQNALRINGTRIADTTPVEMLRYAVLSFVDTATANAAQALREERYAVEQARRTVQQRAIQEREQSAEQWREARRANTLRVVDAAPADPEEAQDRDDLQAAS